MQQARVNELLSWVPGIWTVSNNNIWLGLFVCWFSWDKVHSFFCLSLNLRGCSKDLHHVLSDCSRPSHIPNRVYSLMGKCQELEGIGDSVWVSKEFIVLCCDSDCACIIEPLQREGTSGGLWHSLLDQDWIHTKFLRVLCSQTLKVYNDKDCTVSLGSLLQYWSFSLWQ